jgi:hypothetical protein
MTHYSNFILLVVQLLLVKSNDSESNSFYHKLLTTTIQSRVPHVSGHDSIRKESIMLHPDAFFEQTTTSITARRRVRDFDHSRIDAIYEAIKKDQHCRSGSYRYFGKSRMKSKIS